MGEPARRSEHAKAIMARAESEAVRHWGSTGWRRLTSEARHAYVCLYVIDILNQEKVRAALTVDSLCDVVDLARLMPTI